VNLVSICRLMCEFCVNFSRFSTQASESKFVNTFSQMTIFDRNFLGNFLSSAPLWRPNSAGRRRLLTSRQEKVGANKRGAFLIFWGANRMGEK